MVPLERPLYTWQILKKVRESGGGHIDYRDARQIYEEKPDLVSDVRVRDGGYGRTYEFSLRDPETDSVLEMTTFLDPRP